MKRVYACCLLIGQLICISVQSQYYFSSGNRAEPELLWELGASAGAMNCLTDIGGGKGSGQKFIKDINLDKTQFCGSLFLGAAWHSWLGLRLTATMGQITGSDDVLKNTSGMAANRYWRHLQFRTSILELAATAEFHLLPVIMPNNDIPLFSPYIATGIAFFNYNPQAQLNNTWVDLRPLHTEGEGFKEYPDQKEYKSVAWCLPVGAGIKYDASGLVILRCEILYRITGTDYLDDVSNKYIDPLLFSKYLSPAQASIAAKLYDRIAELTPGTKERINGIRGNPNSKDAFFSLHFSISIAFGRTERK